MSNNIDELLFESTVPDLFDEIHLALHEIIKSQISTLPFPNADDTCKENGKEGGGGESREEQLRNSILATYSRHMDLAEVYATKNLFSLSKKEFSKKQRERIYQIYQKYSSRVETSNETKDAACTKPRKNDKVAEDAMERLRQSKFNTDIEIKASPTVADVNALTEELDQLRIKLRNGKLRRYRLQMELCALEEKKETASKVKSAFSHDANSIPEQISGAVLMGKEGLVELNEGAKTMIQTLNGIKASRGENDNETMEFGLLMKEKALEAQRPMKKMTLEEDYEKRRNMNLITGGSRVESNLLKKGEFAKSSEKM